MVNIYRINVTFEIADRPLIITVWPGSLMLKIVYDLLHRVGIDFAKREKKPLIIEPPLRDGRYILAGIYERDRDDIISTRNSMKVLEPGTRFSLNLYITESELSQRLLEALLMSDIVALPRTELFIRGLTFEELEVPNICSEASGDWCTIRILVSFRTPTCFMLHGNDILYPSPMRLVYNIAKFYTYLTGMDLKHVCDQVSKIMDISNILKIVKLLVDIGEGRRVPAFMGRVVYVVSGRSNIVHLLLMLFKFAEIVGVGISRALGFGRLRIERIVAG
ncbi:MAG: CRISPR system precrRNA processing endoribonuclease RAMP protein Cas6 [Crenarchaeota archaeon]|nr:CRISPR system precrRNA processing endoribonuclease RAMP protein Cas6 [Thermoproteota archaeon]